MQGSCQRVPSFTHPGRTRDESERRAGAELPIMGRAVVRNSSATDSAYSAGLRRLRRLGARQLCSLGVASVFHALPAASQTARLARRCALGPRLVPRRRAPSCAAARRTRALTPSWPQSACRPTSRQEQARPGMAGLTCSTGRKSRRAQRATYRHRCKYQRSGSKGRSSWSGRSRVRLGVRLQQVIPAAPPDAGARFRLVDRDIVLLRCCILLLH
jgi:hypothetical protein